MFRYFICAMITIFTTSTVELGAKPITMFGLNLGMADLKTEVAKKGYSCETGQNIWGTVQTVCSSGEKEITITDDKIYFNCKVFNGCGFSLAEVAQNVADQGLVQQSFQYSREDVGGYNSGVVRETYCARGTDGDILCVVATTFMSVKIGIEIQKGTLGRGGDVF